MGFKWFSPVHWLTHGGFNPDLQWCWSAVCYLPH